MRDHDVELMSGADLRSTGAGAERSICVPEFLADSDEFGSASHIAQELLDRREQTLGTAARVVYRKRPARDR